MPPTCGDNVVDPGEDCDGTSDARLPRQLHGSCSAPARASLPSEIPTTVAFIGRPGSELDTGWTGIGHDSQTADNAALMAGTVSNCDLDTGSPTCGRCDLNGPVAFPGPAKNCVCSNLATPDSSSLAACNPQAPSCGGGETVLVSPRTPAPDFGRCGAGLRGQPSDRGGLGDRQHLRRSGPHAGEGSVQLQLSSAVHNGEGRRAALNRCTSFSYVLLNRSLWCDVSASGGVCAAFRALLRKMSPRS